VFWPLVGSFDGFCSGLFCWRVIACASHASNMLRSFSEKVTKLNTKSVLVVEASETFLVLLGFLLFLVALDALLVVVQNVEIEPVDSRSSCIFAMVSAQIDAPDMSISKLLSRKSNPCQR